MIMISNKTISEASIAVINKINLEKNKRQYSLYIIL